MKLSVDSKFLLTAAATFLVLVVIVAIVNRIAGTPAATVVGAVAGAVAVKLFDKLDYAPDREIEFGARLISVPWRYGAIASMLILRGASIGAELAGNLIGLSTSKPDSCTALAITTVSLLDWLGYALGGWIIGRLFPKHALGYASLAAIVLFVLVLFDRAVGSAETMSWLGPCLFGTPLRAAEATENAGPFKLGLILGAAARGYLAILSAHLAKKRMTNTDARLSSRGDR